jgi:hypothetical protein
MYIHRGILLRSFLHSLGILLSKHLYKLMYIHHGKLLYKILRNLSKYHYSLQNILLNS